MEKNWKKFHFQELDWLICFPSSGNEGRKYLYYSIAFVNPKNGKEEVQVGLGDVVDTTEFEKNFPHTVGYLKGPIEEGADFKSAYLEIRIIRTIEEFWKFLNDLDI